jgi:hypothetical protein
MEPDVSVTCSLVEWVPAFLWEVDMVAVPSPPTKGLKSQKPLVSKLVAVETVPGKEFVATVPQVVAEADWAEPKTSEPATSSPRVPAEPRALIVLI